MLQEIDKALVKERFKKSMSLTSYDKNASVQSIMAEHLLKELELFSKGRSFKKIFELGAGTGILTRKILSVYNPEIFITNDLVEDSEKYIKSIIDSYSKPCRYDFISGDIEKITEYPKNIDLVISNATIQWLADIKLFFRKLAANISKGTMIAFTTFGPDNLLEFNKVNSSRLKYTGIDDIREMLKNEFEIYKIKDEHLKLEFDLPVGVLRHLRVTGVTGISRISWTKKQLEEFTMNYIKNFGSGNGVTLTYNPIYLIGKRK
ncbi:MAG: malonyl-ACP O-methyltransferase BioC [Candidatus Delongbacteria bacterium]|nr:malonyl-ACP O-methyltransferase BioC [Candidatus Delongbacteria bacterium]MCG2760935.1 malonyl-ACP O-methyltransferase BioC [Candidatus Delongbacteria bacterium]